MNLVNDRADLSLAKEIEHLLLPRRDNVKSFCVEFASSLFANATQDSVILASCEFLVKRPHMDHNANYRPKRNESWLISGCDGSLFQQENRKPIATIAQARVADRLTNWPGKTGFN
jgi:hypothetical protein